MLDGSFRDLQAGLTEVAATVAEAIFAIERAKLRMGLGVSYPRTAIKRSRPKMRNTDDVTTQDIKPSKRSRFLRFLESGDGHWKRRDGDHLYYYVGEDPDLADSYIMKRVDSDKPIKITLVCLLSKWEHVG
jgi:hypothetical protein